MSDKIIYVYENWTAAVPRHIGNLYCSAAHNRESFSFEFTKDFLQNYPRRLILDPNLYSTPGRQYSASGALFGVFEDACPDRWGRTLLKRNEASLARKETRHPKTLLPSDFLLGVTDETRMGALRFSLNQNDFLSNNPDSTVPPITSLRAIEAAIERFEKNDNMEMEEVLQLLMAPGSSLGGARPKATVMNVDSSLWVAKFPSKNDPYNVGAWEMVCHDLAALCGINVPEAMLTRTSKNGDIYLSKRFDRNGAKRVHFASAMTMLGKEDGDSASYLDILEFLKQNATSPQNSYLELFKRVGFNILVSNTDDHLRNHGFVLNETGWILSPAYDINPNIYSSHLSLTIDDADSTKDLELLYETAEFYNISYKDADDILRNMIDTVNKNWVKIAKKYKIRNSELELMRDAFSYCDRPYPKKLKSQINESGGP